jgi:hypothetical protein
MNYKDAWEELKDGLYKAEYDINKMTDNAVTKTEEVRLIGKLSGIRVALGHMKDIESSID